MSQNLSSAAVTLCTSTIKTFKTVDREEAEEVDSYSRDKNSNIKEGRKGTLETGKKMIYSIRKG